MTRSQITIMFFTMLLTGCASGIQPATPGSNASVLSSKSGPDQSAAQRGVVLCKERHGGLPACATCHTLDASRLVGPGFRGVATGAGQHVPGETPSDYLHNVIVQPGAYIVQGYDNVMPPTYGTTLS